MTRISEKKNVLSVLSVTFCLIFFGVLAYQRYHHVPVKPPPLLAVAGNGQTWCSDPTGTTWWARADGQCYAEDQIKNGFHVWNNVTTDSATTTGTVIRGGVISDKVLPVSNGNMGVPNPEKLLREAAKAKHLKFKVERSWVFPSKFYASAENKAGDKWMESGDTMEKAEYNLWCEIQRPPTEPHRPFIKPVTGDYR